MDKTIHELKMLIKDLILEVGDLKERVTNLERELNPEPEQEEYQAPMELTEPLEIQGEGYEQLGKLYRDGYHVCPTAFGKRRTDECLFCIAFMEKE